MTDQIPKAQYFLKLQRVGIEIAKVESLPLKSIELYKFKKFQGMCKKDGSILITLKPSTMEELPRIQEDCRTLAHELAHLKHFHHNKEFWEYAALLCEMIGQKFGIRVPRERVMT